MKKLLMALLLCAALLPLCAGACAAENTPVPIEPAEAFAGGSGTAEDPFQIATAQQLALLAKVTHQEYEWNQWDEEELYLEGCYVLTADIALNDTSNFANWESEPPAYVWDPIGAASKDSERTYFRFSGVFDGQGHTISGLYSLSARLHENEQIAGGLFGEAFQAEIRNVNLTDSMLIAAEKQKAGLLVGSGSGSVMENCHVSGRLIVDHVYDSGGVAGDVWGSAFTDCSFSGSIAAENISGHVGGVCGTLSCTGERLVNDASIEVRNSHVLSACGGVVGNVYHAALRDSVNNGSITVYGQTFVPNIGGVCGDVAAGYTHAKDENGNTLEDENGKWIKVPANAEIIGCTNNGSVTAVESEMVGGIAGSASSVFHPVGTVTIQGCVNNGEILGLENVGGIAGEAHSEYGNYQLKQCVNTGSVTASTRVAGIVGSTNTTMGASVIEDCENRGSVTATSEESGTAGGILGWGVDPTLCYRKGDSGSLTIQKCRNSGSVTVNAGTAGGIMSRLMHSGHDFFIEITQCENTGAIHSNQSGRLGGILGGTYAGYVVGFEGKPACTIRSCVNSGDLSYGDAAVNVVDYVPREPGDGSVLNATEKTWVAMGGKAVGGIVGTSFDTVVESCLNRGHILLPRGVAPLSDVEANVRMTEDDSVVFVGGICGLTLHNSERDAFETEHYTDCAYTDSFAAAVYAPFLPADSEVITGNRQITAEEADALAAELLR
ncbi:MAG: hypothetical protein SPG80_09040 [Candidatus Ventricola sp.]|nr:hypothetical protein [Candidatus Ventricola sp.]